MAVFLQSILWVSLCLVFCPLRAGQNTLKEGGAVRVYKANGDSVTGENASTNDDYRTMDEHEEAFYEHSDGADVGQHDITDLSSTTTESDDGTGRDENLATHEYIDKVCWYFDKKMDQDEYLTDYNVFLPDSTRFMEGKITCNISDRKADCSNRSLTTVPSDLPRDITSLNLDRNYLSSLEDNVFINYTNLEILTIALNNISVLSNLSFVGLSKLQALSLWGNHLTMNNSTFPADVFLPLQSLKCLKINQNNHDIKESGLQYPDQALSRLKKLKSLYMDGIPDGKFGAGFSELKQLTELNFKGFKSGYCKMNSLSNDTFVNVIHLRYLSLSNCNLKGPQIEAGAFEPLKNLTTLTISHNEDIDIQNLKKVFYGLQTSSLKHLYMQLIVSRYSIGICLSHEIFKYFPRHLKSFDAQENSIEAVDRQVIGLLSHSLEVLHLSGNKFVFGTYLHDLPKMKNLRELYLNGSNYEYNLPKNYPYPFTRPLAQDNSTCNLYGSEVESFILQLPPNLTHIEMNEFGLDYRLSGLNVHENNILTNLSIRGNRFPSLIGPITGLHSLKYLDLSNNSVVTISETFFETFPSLEVLLLGANVLSKFFADTSSLTVFASLQNLKHLNISNNNIFSMTPGVLDKLVSLTHLILNDNPLHNFSVNITRMKRLSNLNLMYTKISTLSVETRLAIDSILDEGIPINVQMQQAPINCDCENLPFLQWMIKSAAFNRTFRNYVCANRDTITKISDGYNKTMAYLERQCISNALLFFIIASATLVALGIIFGAVIYRFRWKLRYLYYAAYLYYSKTRKENPDQFDSDAFICYAQEDESFVVRKLLPELERRGLKVFVHGRDFVVGDFIASNIVRAVCQSRRTIVVLTRHMINSYWCGYEIQMANLESVHTGSRVLVFLLMEELPAKDLGVELLYNIHNNTYIQYPVSQSDPTDMIGLWDKLANDVRT